MPDGQRGEILVGDLHPVHIGRHPQNRLPEGEEVDVGVRQRDRHRVHDELAEPLAKYPPITEHPLEVWFQRLDVDQGLVHVEDQDRRLVIHLRWPRS